MQESDFVSGSITPGWEIVSSKVHFRNDHLAVSGDEVRTPARNSARLWTVVHRKRAVVILPMTAQNEIILIRQERIPIQAAIWEVPAGQVDQSGEISPSILQEVALRELREETGYELAEGGELIGLGDYFTSPGLTDEHVYLFLARPVQLSPSGHERDESESILECRAFTADELIGMIRENEIRDANTLAICARLMARGELRWNNGVTA